MQKVIMFNGPPRSGKDTAGEVAKELLGSDITLVKFTDAVKNEAHRRLGLDCPPLHYEVLKDVPLPEFEGKTPRDYYIETSADLKKKHGEHVVAARLVEQLEDVTTPLIVNTDVGYDYEAQHLIDRFGIENCVMIRIHRQGKTFQGDCRDWVDIPGLEAVDISNRGLENFKADIERILHSIRITPELAW